MTKSQLISANNLEMSSGIEVINRLKRSGWIKEKDNPEDRRSKRIHTSDEGTAVLDEYRASGLSIYKSYVLKSLELLSKINS